GGTQGLQVALAKGVVDPSNVLGLRAAFFFGPHISVRPHRWHIRHSLDQRSLPPCHVFVFSQIPRGTRYLTRVPASATDVRASISLGTNIYVGITGEQAPQMGGRSPFRCGTSS